MREEQRVADSEGEGGRRVSAGTDDAETPPTSADNGMKIL